MENEFFEKLKLFFSPKEQIHNHWYAPVAGFHFVSADFYKMIEKELEARKVPGLQISRIEFSEGGLLSAKREYLRLSRERLVFDICAAPFGTGYFFSFRFVELPLGVQPLAMLVLVVPGLTIFGLLVHFLGSWGLILFFALVAAGIWTMRNAVALGLKDLDSTLLKSPVFGPIYEILCRKETYYREDTRLMYLSTVNEVTKALVDEVTVAKGIKVVKRYERKPVLADLYREKTSVPADAPPPIAGG